MMVSDIRLSETFMRAYLKFKAKCFVETSEAVAKMLMFVPSKPFLANRVVEGDGPFSDRSREVQNKAVNKAECAVREYKSVLCVLLLRCSMKIRMCF